MSAREASFPIAVRLSAFYALVFAFVAVQLSYWPLWLKEQGLGDVLLGPLIAFGFVAKVVINPVFRRFAVRLGGTRTALLSTLLASLIAFNLFAIHSAVWFVSLVQLLFLACWVPVLPATEHIALSKVRCGVIDYGSVRLWGSLAFLLTTISVGRLLEGGGIDLAFRIQLGLLTVMLLAGFLLPRDGGSSDARRGFALRQLLSVRGLPTMLAIAALVQSSHAMLYVFGSIYWKSIGIGESIIGVLWAEGVAVEVGVFLLGRRLGRLGAVTLLGLGGAAACLRWGLMPLATEPFQFAMLQLLHGVTFGMAHLGAMRFMTERVPEALAANAVALYSMVVMGGAMGAAVFASGWLFATFGARAFLVMALLGLAGVVLACTDQRRHSQ